METLLTHQVNHVGHLCTARPAPPRPLGGRATLREGLVTGALGATAVAVWFLIVDTVAGIPLFTPLALGVMLFGGAAAHPSLPLVIGYKVFRFAAFAAVRLAAAHFSGVAERQGAFTALFFILFVAFEVGFYGMIAVLDATGILAALTWFQIGIGNLLATVVMGGYLWRRHPTLGMRLEEALSRRERSPSWRPWRLGENSLPFLPARSVAVHHR